MTDRDLLALAAKTSGGLLYVADIDAWIECDESTGARGKWWNPLTDDGDALRLAVKLGLRVCIDNRAGFSWIKKFEGSTAHGDDAASATRRAIVRAAAEIGRAMP